MDKGEFPEEVLDYLQTLDNFTVVSEIWQVIMQNYGSAFFQSQIRQMRNFIDSIRTEADVIPTVKLFLEYCKTCLGSRTNCPSDN